MSIFNEESDVTLCITSCGRLHLLQQTLDSFLPANSKQIFAAYIIEDANCHQVKKWIESAYPDVQVIMNDPKLGHMKSVDRLYESVQTKYIFHCEDDWLFDGREVISSCKALLEGIEWTHIVAVRKPDDIRGTLLEEWEYHSFDNFEYSYKRPESWDWGAFSLNPCLVRKSLWEQYGPYAPFKYEVEINRLMKEHNKVVVHLEPGACVHIGWDDHVVDPFQPHVKRPIHQRVKRSVQKRVSRVLELFS